MLCKSINESINQLINQGANLSIKTKSLQINESAEKGHIDPAKNSPSSFTDLAGLYILHTAYILHRYDVENERCTVKH